MDYMYGSKLHFGDLKDMNVWTEFLDMDPNLMHQNLQRGANKGQ